MSKPNDNKDNIYEFLTFVAILCGLGVWIYSSWSTPEERALYCQRAMRDERVAFKRRENLLLRYKQLYGREIELSQIVSPSGTLEGEISQADGEWLNAMGIASSCK